MAWNNIQQEAERFLKHKGVSVYHTYENDQIDEGKNTYHFVLNQWDVHEESFDVRDLSTWVAPQHPPYLCGDGDTPENRAAWKQYREDEVELGAIKSAIRRAIDQGELQAPKEQEDHHG